MSVPAREHDQWAAKNAKQAVEGELETYKQNVAALELEVAALKRKLKEVRRRQSRLPERHVWHYLAPPHPLADRRRAHRPTSWSRNVLPRYDPTLKSPLSTCLT